MLPQRPGIIALAGEDVAFNSVTILAAAGTTGLRYQNGAGASGGNSNIVSAAATLTAGQSGSTCLWNAAAGFTYTLPAPVVGMRFTFLVTVTNTSSNHKLITDAGTTFLKGSIQEFIENTTPAANPGPKDFPFDGSSHVSIVMNGTTTGGLVGTWIEVVAISTTLWAIRGIVKASGTIATPAATS